MGSEPPVRRMEAEGRFFGGQIEVEALLARAGVRWSRADSKDGGGSSGEHSAGGGGGGMRGGFGGRHRGGGERGQRGGEMAGGQEGPRPPPIYASNQAPIWLRLRLTNHGPDPADIEVVDFDSVLGDFAVQPEKITVDPGKSVEADPMVSRLGVPTEKVPLTVKLQIGQRSEQQVLSLHFVADAPVAPAAGPAAPGKTPPTPASERTPPPT